MEYLRFIYLKYCAIDIAIWYWNEFLLYKMIAIVVHITYINHEVFIVLNNFMVNIILIFLLEVLQ